MIITIYAELLLTMTSELPWNMTLVKRNCLPQWIVIIGLPTITSCATFSFQMLSVSLIAWKWTRIKTWQRPANLWHPYGTATYRTKYLSWPKRGFSLIPSFSFMGLILSGKSHLVINLGGNCFVASSHFLPLQWPNSQSHLKF